MAKPRGLRPEPPSRPVHIELLAVAHGEQLDALRLHVIATASISVPDNLGLTAPDNVGLSIERLKKGKEQRADFRIDWDERQIYLEVKACHPREGEHFIRRVMDDAFDSTIARSELLRKGARFAQSELVIQPHQRPNEKEYSPRSSKFLSVRIPPKATTHSGGFRPGSPEDSDHHAGADAGQ